MVIDFYNRNGGGGSADYATLAGESNKSKLLEGGSALPQSANTGDVVAVGADLRKRGAKSPSPTLGIYQYDGSAWNPIGGETPETTSLKPVSELPESGETGEVVALYATLTIYGAIKVPENSISYDGDDILEITTDLGTLTINTFEDNGTNVIKLTNGVEGVEEFIVIGDNNSATLPTNDENYTWDAILKGGTLIMRVSEGASFHPIFTEDSIVLNTCDAFLDNADGEETELGIYQYDGSSWNEIGGGSSAYKIELSSVDPQYYTQQDRETLIDFYTAFTADTSIADSAYIYAVDGIYRCVRYIVIPNSPIFNFEGTYNNNIVDIWLHFSNGRFSYGSLQNAVPTPETTSLKPATDFPENPVEGEIVPLSEEELIDYRPEAPDGQTVYGGNLEEFMVAIKGTSDNQLWVSTWDDAGHTERTDQGYFHLESDAINYYDYQGDMDYLFNDLNEGEWADANTIYLLKEGNNLYFYVKQEAEGVFFRETDSTMEFETVVTDNTLNQYDGGDWKIFPQVLNSREEFPKLAALGDVVGIGKYGEREATSADVFTSATVTMVNGRATFKMYNPNYGGYCEDYTFGYDVNEGIIGSWGGENNVINGPWNDHGVEFTIDGDDITFTTQNPENTNEALQMWGFDPNCNDRIAIKELGIYQKDEEGWNRAVTSNSINSIVKLTQAEYDALVSGGTVDNNTFYVIISPNV